MFSVYFLGIVLAIGSAICNALTQAVLSRPLIKADSSSVAFLTSLEGLVISGVLIIGSSGFSSVPKFPSSTAIAVFVIVGIVQYGISRRIFYHSIRNLGANITTPINMTATTLGGIALAVVLLSEKVTLPIISGVVLVILGALFLQAGRAAGMRGGATRSGYIAAIVSGVIPAFSAVLISYGLSIYPYVIAAVFISFIASSSYYLVVLKPRSLAKLLKVSTRKSVVAFLGAGLASLATQLFRAGALDIAPVVVVVPLLTASILFSPLFTQILAKDIEVFDLRTILGMIVVTVGLVLVTL